MSGAEAQCLAFAVGGGGERVCPYFLFLPQAKSRLEQNGLGGGGADGFWDCPGLDWVADGSFESPGGDDEGSEGAF